MTNEFQSNAPEPPPTNLEDVCSLSPTAFEDRLAMVRREIQPFAVSTQTHENAIAWDFEATPEMRARLENLARLERDCCSGLEFEVWENGSRTRLRFEVTGVDPSSGFFDDLRLSNPTGKTPAPRRWSRLLKRGGLAAGASFVVCCVIPVALVSFVGTSVAAPLMKLDDPLVIAGGTGLFATLFWLFERRQTARSTVRPDATTGGCGC